MAGKKNKCYFTEINQELPKSKKLQRTKLLLSGFIEFQTQIIGSQDREIK
jgi:hypothetical protein